MGIEKHYGESYWRDGKHAIPELTEPVFLRLMGPVLSRDSVLDYGCGMGYAYQRRLTAAVRRYVGADVSGMAVADARSKGLEAIPVNPDNSTVELPDASVEGAVCIEVFEHLFDPLCAARELNRVLKPGGVLVATVPNFGYHAYRMMALLRAQVPAEPEDIRKNRYNGVHIRFFSQYMFKRMLRDAGFEDIKIGSYDDANVWDVFQATGPLAIIASYSRRYFPKFLHLRFLQDIWPNVFAMRLRATARKPVG